MPNIYLLSDPDLELNNNIPDNFVEILYNLSNKYKRYKTGLALDISDKDNFINCGNDFDIYGTQQEFWKINLNDDEYEIYDANVDTTFCLINNNYYRNNNYDGIRVVGNFTAKHLPWYKNYIKDNISSDELNIWKKNNKSSSILWTCLHE